MNIWSYKNKFIIPRITSTSPFVRPTKFQKVRGTKLMEICSILKIPATLQQHGCVMFLAPTRQVTNVRPSRDSPHRAVIPPDMPEYQCPWFQYWRASNFYCMAIAAEPSLPSGPPSATDWAAVSVTVASETTRHAPGAVRQAGGDEL
jgi:hypothetical protein